ncbi:MAG: DotA/TraY family protein [Alphaproteobacteria bacterium]|nr:DotA/TraY family protein [Alphaproteobacteria bacterium]
MFRPRLVLPVSRLAVLCAVAAGMAWAIAGDAAAQGLTNPWFQAPPTVPGTDGAEHQGFTIDDAQAWFESEHGDPLTAIYLNELFGPLFPAPDRAPDAPTATVFSTVIGFFNVISLALGGLLFAWNALAGLMQTAHEGELLGRRWSSLWAPPRIVLAVGLLVPLPGLDGYNAAQAGVAYVVRGATLAASFVWSEATEALVDDRVPLAAAQPRFRGETLTAMYQIAACETIVQNGIAALDDPGIVLETDGPEEVGRPGGFTLRQTLVLRRSGAAPSTGVRTSVPVCGYWEAPPMTDEIDGYISASGLDAAASRQVLATYRQGHLQVMRNLNAAMRTIAAEKGGVILGDRAGEDPIPAHRVEIAEAIIEANTALSRLARDLLDQVSRFAAGSTDKRQLILNAISGGEDCSVRGTRHCYGEGWIGAGQWYVGLARINNQVMHLTGAVGRAKSDTLQAPEAGLLQTTLSRARDGFFGTLRGWMGGIGTAGNYLDLEEADAAMASFMAAWEADTSQLIALGMRVDPADLGLASESWTPLRDGLTSLVGLDMQDLFEAISIVDVDQDPLIQMIELGGTLINFAAVVGAGSLLPGLDWLGFAAPILWAAGALLQVVLPLMPWVVWVLAVTGYFLLVMEAVVGVTLWAFAHLRMDGEGISGAATAGWTLLLSLLLTPVLMIFGLLAGMMIFRVTSALLIAGTFPAIHAALGGGSVVVILMVIPAAVLFLAIVQLLLIERSFSLISEFPSRVLAWIGGRADLADQGATERARAAMIGGAAAFSRIGSGVGGAIQAGRGRLGRAPPGDGRGALPPAEGSDRTTRE